MRKGLARARVASNKNAGAQFERIFIHRAAMCGLLAMRNELSFKYLGGGKMLPIRTDLDFKLIRRDGRVGVFDCKAFAGAHITRSQIDPHQLVRAIRYQAWNVPSGFVVWLKGLQAVYFFGPTAIQSLRPRQKLEAEDGVCLGGPLAFDLNLLFDVCHLLA